MKETTETSKLAGLVPMYRFMQNAGLDTIVDNLLGTRHARAEYTNSDMVKSWIGTVHTQGYRLQRLEDTKEDLSFLGLNICSPDTMGRFFKNLAFENRKVRYSNNRRKKGFYREYTINENPLLIDLLIKVTKAMGAFDNNTAHILDIDSTPLISGTRDAERNYKGDIGYSSMVGIINKNVVYSDIRSGKTPPEFETKSSLEKCLEVLNKNEISISRVRVDGAGYTKEVTNFIHSKGLQFVIGADWSERAYEFSKGCTDWKKHRIKTFENDWKNAQLSSFPFSFANETNIFRMIVIRTPKEDRNKDKDIAKWTLMEGYYYKFILTNDELASEYDLTLEYHKRGGFERNFDYLKNDMGWKILPFSQMNHNLVYLLMCAIANNVYRSFLKFVVDTIGNIIKITYRLGTFVRKFIKGTVEVINGNYDFSKAKMPYQKLM